MSCKPTSLVRDLESFLAAGYQVEKAVCCDMFSWTENVETIALLQKSNRKSKPDTYVKLSLDMEDYYRIMDQEK